MKATDVSPWVGRARFASILLLCVSIAFGAYLRLRHVESAFLFGDEQHSLRAVDSSYAELFSTYNRRGAGVPLPILQKALIGLLGFHPWAIRGPMAVAGLICLLLLYPVARLISSIEAAAIGIGILAVNAQHVFYAHYGRPYELVAMLGLMLLWVQIRLIKAPRIRDWEVIAHGVVFGLIPYIHLSAASYSLCLTFGTACALAADSERRARIKSLLIAVLLGTALVVVLYWASFDTLMDFVRAKTSTSYYGRFGILDVLALLIGARWLIWATGLLMVPGILIFLRRDRSLGPPLLLAAFGPLVGLAVVRPFGDAYAFARYAMPALPVICLLTAVSLKAVVDAVVPRSAPWMSVVAGCVVVAAVYVGGPLGIRHTPDGPFANTYLSLMPLPAFDKAFTDTPAFYRRFDGAKKEVRLVEVPALPNRTLQLYRNYYLQHRQDTLLGVLPGRFDVPLKGRMIRLSGADDYLSLARQGTDYLLVHHDVGAEIAQYWQFVFKDRTWKKGNLRAYMERQKRYMPDMVPSISDEWVRGLGKILGSPVYRDKHIIVWQLRGDREIAAPQLTAMEPGSHD